MGRPASAASAASEASAFWLDTQTSARLAETRAVQFIGSMQACDTKGVW